MKKMMVKFAMWLLRKALGVKRLKSPVEVLWDMIDEENRNGSMTYENGEPAPDCGKIEAWEEAAARIAKECFGAEGGERRC